MGDAHQRRLELQRQRRANQRGMTTEEIRAQREAKELAEHFSMCSAMTEAEKDKYAFPHDITPQNMAPKERARLDAFKSVLRTRQSREKKKQEKTVESVELPAKHLEMLASMTEADKDKYVFPHDIPRRLMTADEQHQYDKCMNVINKRKEKENMTPEQWQQKLDYATQHRAKKKKTATEEEKVAEREWRRNYMNEYNKRGREEDPERYKEIYKKSNDKRQRKKEPAPGKENVAPPATEASASPPAMQALVSPPATEASTSREEQQLAKHREFVATLTEKDKEKWSFPHDRLPRNMTPEQKTAYEKCKAAIRARDKRKAVAADPELAAIAKAKDKARKQAEEYKAVADKINENRNRRYEEDKAYREAKIEAAKRVYQDQKERGESYWQRTQQDPERHEAVKEKMRINRENYMRVCPTCTVKHDSRLYDECEGCRITQDRYKLEESSIVDLLKAHDIHPSLQDRRGPCFEKGNRRRADFVFVADHWTVVLEVDEDEHRSYPAECEITRIADLRDQMPGRPLHFIRFSPVLKKKAYVRKGRTQAERSSKHGGIKTFTAMRADSERLLVASLKIAFALPPPRENEFPRGYAWSFIGYSDERKEELLRQDQNMHSLAFSSPAPLSLAGTSAPPPRSLITIGIEDINNAQERLQLASSSDPASKYSPRGVVDCVLQQYALSLQKEEEVAKNRKLAKEKTKNDPKRSVLDESAVTTKKKRRSRSFLTDEERRKRRREANKRHYEKKKAAGEHGNAPVNNN